MSTKLKCGVKEPAYTITLLILFAISTQAATFTVTKIADTDDGVCDSDCSLREAIDEANTFATDDIIEFASPLFDTAQTITLGGTQLEIINNGSLTINGTGARLLSISGNNSSRVLQTNGRTTLNDLTIRDGNGGRGAGINKTGGRLTIFRCAVSNNTSNSFGGGINNFRGLLEVLSSTISDNTTSLADATSGGIDSSSNVIITNSTISGNSAPNGTLSGGGLWANFGTITNSTVTNNSVRNGFGGIFRNINANPFRISNTIVAGNTVSGSPNNPDVGHRNSDSGTFNSDGYNLIGNVGTANGFTNGVNGDQVGTSGSPINPMLGPLANNGGPTDTHALLSGSPAIDAGNPTTFEPTDQRGTSRPLDGDGNGVTVSDIGAFERNNSFLVTKTADTNDGTCDSDCSLREAIAAANAAATDDIIEFASPLFDTAQTITLGGTRLQIANNGSLTINGTGAKLLTIDADRLSRVFRVNTATAILNDLTITRGNSAISSGSRSGGGIHNVGGNLTVNNSVLSNSRTGSSGGGAIQTDGGVLNFNSSTASGNRTGLSGAGIGIRNAVVTVVNSTISGNTSVKGNGGGLYIENGTLTIINSTIANNSAGSFGGGIHRAGASVRIKNTIVADNTAVDIGSDIRGTIISEGYNLIENTNGATINGDTTGNITGQDPMLFPLADYGGPTPTHAPSINSPVIDKGSAATVPLTPFGNSNSKSFNSKSNSNLANLMMPLTTDQRGIMRPQDVFFIANAPGGDGSDIGAFEAFAPTAAAVSVSGRVITNGKGRAIPNVTIQISNAGGIIQTVRTNHFGRFRFTGIEAGETYIFTIQSKGYQFAPQVINVGESINDLVFTPN